MKSLVLFFILVVCLSCAKPAPKIMYDLNLKLLLCNEENEFDHYSYIRLFKGDSLFKTVESSFVNQVKIDSLYEGEYKLEFHTLFYENRIVPFEINEHSQDTIKLCMNYLDYNNQNHIPFIDKLKNDESYNMNIESSGCFHHSEENIIIEKKEDNYFITYNRKRKKINKEGIQLIRRFEFELMHMSKGGGCTTYTKYLLIYKNEKIDITDGSCRWLGPSKFLNKLFPEDENE